MRSGGRRSRSRSSSSSASAWSAARSRSTSAGSSSAGGRPGCCSLGILVFPLIITGVVLNTIFLVREIRRNEQHEAFINAVTHELKTPVASMKLYLQTLQNRQVDDAKRQEFYRAMLEDSDRLLGTIEQVLRAGQHRRADPRRRATTPIDLSRSCRNAWRWREPGISLAARRR